MHTTLPTLGFLIHDVARLMKKRFEQNARGSGLTRSQWQVLVYLAKNEGICQRQLAELMELEPQPSAGLSTVWPIRV
jgi:DNA-binding MarR family transcriptional regulator